MRPVAGEVDIEQQPSSATLPGSLVKELAGVEGAARADGNITNFGTFVVGKNGKVIFRAAGAPPADEILREIANAKDS